MCLNLRLQEIVELEFEATAGSAHPPTFLLNPLEFFSSIEFCYPKGTSTKICLAPVCAPRWIGCLLEVLVRGTIRPRDSRTLSLAEALVTVDPVSLWLWFPASAGPASPDLGTPAMRTNTGSSPRAERRPASSILPGCPPHTAGKLRDGELPLPPSSWEASWGRAEGPHPAGCLCLNPLYVLKHCDRSHISVYVCKCLILPLLFAPSRPQALAINYF